MKNRFKAALSLLLGYFLIVGGFTPLLRAQQGTNASYVVGERNVAWYAFGRGLVQGAFITNGNAATGSQTITVCPAIRALPDGRDVNLFGGIAGLPVVPITIDAESSTNVETVTPTAVSLTGPQQLQGSNQQVPCANITASFSFTHPPSQNTHQVISGDGGLQEAINDAHLAGGGIVTVGADSSALVTNTILSAAVEFPDVAISDKRFDQQYWNTQQTAATFLAAPTTLTGSTAVFSTTPAGSYTTAAAYFMSVAYVDVAGQVGPDSGSFSQTPATTLSSLAITAPVASAGAVGYVIRVSLTGGTYSLSYQVPITAAVCKLTTVETVTPACAVANTTYNQSAANAVVTALTVSTSPVGMQLGGVSGTLLTGNPNGRTTYGYVSSSHLASVGIPTVNLAFTAGGIGSATPIAIGTVNIPAGPLNFVGKKIRVCGKFINTDVNSTVQNINIYLDAAGSDVAGSPVQIGSLAATPGPGTAATYTGNFCDTFTTTVSGAGATAGSILEGMSYFNYFLSATPASLFVGGGTKTAAVGSLNLAGGGGFENRISIVHTNTTGNNTPTLQDLTLEVL